MAQAEAPDQPEDPRLAAIQKSVVRIERKLFPSISKQIRDTILKVLGRAFFWGVFTIVPTYGAWQYILLKKGDLKTCIDALHIPTDITARERLMNEQTTKLQSCRRTKECVEACNAIQKIQNDAARESERELSRGMDCFDNMTPRNFREVKRDLRRVWQRMRK